jgi:hypothetical protein
MQVHFHPTALIAAAWLAIGLSCVHAQAPPVGRTDELVGQLTSDDPKVADGARRELEAMGAKVVPLLFEKLLTADWTLKPRLLEVLSAHGREFAKQKLLNGNDSEKIYAALVYELTRAGEPDDYHTPEFNAMVQGLLQGIKSDDKYLRAAAGVTFVWDDKKTIWFDHLHDLIPALISSFDTELIIPRRRKPGPWDVPFSAICEALDGLIGDRLAYFEMKPKIDEKMRRTVPEGAHSQRQVALALGGAREEIEQLRNYWEGWWNRQSGRTATRIGALLIERNLRILETHESDTRPNRIADWSLEFWTGVDRGSLDEWRSWWSVHRDTYSGPEPEE